MKITQANIQKLPDGMHRVDDGLYVKVSGGSRLFYFRYQVDGKRRMLSIGSATALSIARAKEIAVGYRAGLAEGVEPVRKKLVAEPAPVKQVTFRDIYAEAIDVTDDVRQWKNPKSRARWTATLETYVLPAIGDIPLEEVTRDHVIELLRPIWWDKNPTAKKVRGRIERVFAYAIFKGLYSGPNPATYRGNLEMVLPPSGKVHKEEHFEAMTIEETRAVCAAFYAAPSIGHLATVFGILTALRASALVGCRWEEVDWENRILSVAPERRKVELDAPHRVPLSDQAMAILRLIKEHGRLESEFIFASTGSRTGHVAAGTPRVLLQRAVGRDVTLHGSRSTFRVWAEENGKHAKAAEFALMHVEGNAVLRAYQRSDLLEIRRVMMQEWADEIMPMSDVVVVNQGTDKV